MEGLGQVRSHDDGFDEVMVVMGVEFGMEKGTCFHFFDFKWISIDRNQFDWFF